MALDYSPALDRHDVRRKVGVITRAEIVGQNLELGGYLFARDFPEIVEEIAKAATWRRAQAIDSFRDRLVRAGVIHAAVEPAELESWREGRRLRASLRAAAGRLHQSGQRRCDEIRMEARSRMTNFIRRYEPRLACGWAGRAGVVVRSDGCGDRGHEGESLDADKSDIYGSGDSAEGQSGLSGYVD